MYATNRFSRRVLFVWGLLFFLSVSSISNGQTLHVILAVDRDSRAELGESMKVDLENMIWLFRTNVPQQQLNLVTPEVDAITPEGILASIEKLEVEPNDAIVFYYSGHGAFDKEAKKQILQMEGRGNLFRDTLVAKIDAKVPRLAVILTDCCNVQVQNASATRDLQNTPQRFVKVPSSFSPLFENLFVTCKGKVDITSSKLGEYSFVDTAKPSRGSCFTWPLVAFLSDNKTNEDLYWKDVVDKIGPKVQEAFSTAYPKGYSGQMKQSVYVYGLPGVPRLELDPLPAPDVPLLPNTPRLGLRAINHEGGGVRITGVVPKSPAATSDVEIDEIVTAINGKPIANESDYSAAVDASPKKMELHVKKSQGTTRTVHIDLAW